MSSVEALIAQHHTRVQRAALGFLGEEQSAREAAQEALLKAYSARDRYDPSQPFYPWMYRILKNTCLDALRRRRRQPHPAHSEGGGSEELVASAAPSPLELASQAQQEQRLWAAMATLSEPHREILNLRHFQDLSYTEIAELLQVAEGTVMSRLYRARQALAIALQTTGGTDHHG